MKNPSVPTEFVYVGKLCVLLIDLEKNSFIKKNILKEQKGDLICKKKRKNYVKFFE
jgi:hypothetical protein